MNGQLISRGENTWLIRIFRGRDAHGKRRFFNKTVHGTKRQAERERTRLLRERDMGTMVEPSRQTVGEYVSQWLEVTVRAKVREVTRCSYAAWLTRRVIPAIGHMRLAALTTTDVQRLYNDMSAAGLSPRSVRYVHSILHSALEHAVRSNLIARNPAGSKLCTLPRQIRKEMKALNPQEARRFLDEAQGNEWVALWTLLLTTGLRPGEAMGLKWSDLDGTRLVVQRALVWGYGGKWTLAEPKTAKGRRTVLLPERTAKTLRDHRRRQAEDRLAAGAQYDSHDFIFANELGRPTDIRALVRPHFNRILKAAGLPRIRLYDLRHTAATLLLSGGTHAKVASEMLGHSSVTLTLDVYSHVLEGMQAEAAATMERIMSGSGG